MSNAFKQIMASDYAAPITEPARRVWKMTTEPFREFLRCVLKGFTGEDAGGEKFFNELTRCDSFLPTWGSIMGGVLGIAGYGMAGIIIMSNALAGYSLSAQMIGGVFGAVAGSGLGVAIGPFLMMGGITLGCFATGCILEGIPGVIAGAKKFHAHYHMADKFEKAHEDISQIQQNELKMKQEKMPPETRLEFLTVAAKKFGADLETARHTTMPDGKIAKPATPFAP